VGVDIDEPRRDHLALGIDHCIRFFHGQVTNRNNTIAL
jgi:hypothetical protein